MEEKDKIVENGYSGIFRIILSFANKPKIEGLYKGETEEDVFLFLDEEPKKAIGIQKSLIKKRSYVSRYVAPSEKETIKIEAKELIRRLKELRAKNARIK